MTSPTMQLLPRLLRDHQVVLPAMRTPAPVSVQPQDLRRLDVLPAFCAIVPKPHFVYVGFTHKERVAG